MHLCVRAVCSSHITSLVWTDQLLAFVCAALCTRAREWVHGAVSCTKESDGWKSGVSGERSAVSPHSPSRPRGRSPRCSGSPAPEPWGSPESWGWWTGGSWFAQRLHLSSDRDACGRQDQTVSTNWHVNIFLNCFYAQTSPVFCSSLCQLNVMNLSWHPDS